MADDAAGAVRRTPRPARDELIEKAARAMRNRWSCETPPTEENYADAAAVARHGLLADPACAPPTGSEEWALAKRLSYDLMAVDLGFHSESSEPVAHLIRHGWRPAGHTELELEAKLDAARLNASDAERIADGLRAERDALQARLDEIRTVLAEDVETRARFQVDTSTSYGPRFLNRIREIVDREPAALQGDQPAGPPDVIEVHGELLDGRRIVGTVDLRPARELADRLAAEAKTPGGFPYRQHPHPLCGSNVERQQVGDPGHCEDCCSVGHVVAHPDLGCGDVGCYRTHAAEPTGEVDRG